MQKTWRLPADSFHLHAKAGCSRDTTLAELFAHGGISVHLRFDETGRPWLMVEAPEELAIECGGSPSSAAADSVLGGDQLQPAKQWFDRFLEEESLRVQLEADAIESLQWARSHQRPDQQA